MCATCGCSENSKVTVTDPATGEKMILSHAEAHPQDAAHDHPHRHSDDDSHHPDHLHHHQSHPHDHDHDYDHHHDHAQGHEQSVGAITATMHGTTVTLEKEILGKNQLIAERNRGWLIGRGITAFNLVSSPGSGKTTLLEKTLLDLKNEYWIGVIEGDQETVHDTERIRATGCRAVQINTGTGCHLEAEMLQHGLARLAPAPNSLLFIENVGNLVCPALFDLGERAKVTILSVTEGEDKPLKYPHMFRASELMILNKIDLLPYVKFDVGRCIAYAKQVNSQIEVIELSATTGAGMGKWYEWLRHHLHDIQSSRFPGRKSE